MTFDYNQVVKVAENSALTARRGHRGWIIAVIEDRKRFPLDQFPPGIIYSIEFEDGQASDVHENDLELELGI